MNRAEAIAILRAHQPELRAAGVESLSLFGSVARDAATSTSDVDVVVRLSLAARGGGFAYFGRLDDLRLRLEQILGCSVDLVAEPIGTTALRQSIARETTLAF